MDHCITHWQRRITISQRQTIDRNAQPAATRN
jgi:hypothetical protein